MEKLSVSKEFVLAAHKAACGEWKSKIESELPELFPKAKKGDWIFGNCSKTLARFHSGSGFVVDVFHEEKQEEIRPFGNDFRLATKEEIEKHLIALAEKKGFKEGVKISPARQCGHRNVCKGGFTYLEHSDELCAASSGHGGPVIYSKGVWGAPIEEPKTIEITIEEIAKLKGVEASQIKIVK